MKAFFERLGTVIYAIGWLVLLGCGAGAVYCANAYASVVATLPPGFILDNPTNKNTAIALSVVGVVCWVIAWTLRYLLSGRTSLWEDRSNTRRDYDAIQKQALREEAE